MKREFQRQLTEVRRAQILKAAIAVIAEQGFQRTTIKQIAAKAEVADGTIYNYFTNKDDILLAIIAQISEAEVRDIHFAEARQMDFSDFAQAYVAHRMAEVDEGFPMIKVIVAETLANPELGRQIYDQIYQPGFDSAETYFQQLIAEGSLPAMDVAMLTRLFAAPIFGLLLLRMFGDEHVTAHWEDYSELLSQRMLTMLQPQRTTQSLQSTEKKEREEQSEIAAVVEKKRKKKGKKS